MKQTEEPDAEKDTSPVLRGTGFQSGIAYGSLLRVPRLLDHHLTVVGFAIQN